MVYRKHTVNNTHQSVKTNRGEDFGKSAKKDRQNKT